MSKQRNKAVSLPAIEPNAAEIDVGATEILVAVPADRDTEPIRCFPTFAVDLESLAGTGRTTANSRRQEGPSSEQAKHRLAVNVGLVGSRARDARHCGQISDPKEKIANFTHPRRRTGLLIRFSTTGGIGRPAQCLLRPKPYDAPTVKP